MKKLIYALVVITLQHLTLNIQSSFAQASNDNRGSGNCLSFDGVNDNVQVGDVLEGMNALTVSAWIKTQSTSPVAAIVAKWSAGTVSYVLRTGITDAAQASFGVMTSIGGNLEVASTGLTINDGEWHQLTGRYDGTSQQIYVDGVLQGSIAQSGTVLNSTEELCFGIYCNGGPVGTNYFQGEIDEISIWNRALTQTEIRDNMCSQLQGNETGLIGYWNMNEGTGNTVGDLTANGNDGTRQ